MKKEFSKLKWEYLERNRVKEPRGSTFDFIRRTKVPGGWLVESVKYYNENEQIRAEAGYGVGLAFIPDPDYKWIVDEMEFNKE